MAQSLFETVDINKFRYLLLSRNPETGEKTWEEEIGARALFDLVVTKLQFDEIDIYNSIIIERHNEPDCINKLTVRKFIEFHMRMFDTTHTGELDDVSIQTLLDTYDDTHGDDEDFTESRASYDISRSEVARNIAGIDMYSSGGPVNYNTPVGTVDVPTVKKALNTTIKLR